MKLANSTLLSNANENIFYFMLEYADRLAKKDPNRLKRFVESDLIDSKFEYINKILESHFKEDSKNGFYSKNFLNTFNKERIINDYPSIDKINLKDVSNGEVCTVGSQLYVNDNGTITPLKLSKEKFNELFVYNDVYQTAQGNVGDCWLISAINGLMESPAGRVKVYKMFEESGNDIIVNMPNFKYSSIFSPKEFFRLKPYNKSDACIYSIRFKNGEIPEGEIVGMYGAVGLQMLERAYAMIRLDKSSWFRTDLKANKVTDFAEFADVDKILNAAEVGSPCEFISGIYNYQGFHDLDGNVIGEFINCAKDRNKCLSAIQEFSNEENILIYASTKNEKAYKKQGILKNQRNEHLIDGENSLWSNHAYTIKGYDEKTGTIYYSNPHKNAIILELPVDEFLNVFKSIIYMRI